MKYIVVSCLAAAVSFSQLSSAEEINSTAGVVLGEHIGYQFHDDDRALDDGMTVEFYGGYRFGEHWETHLGYSVGGWDSDILQGGKAKFDKAYNLDVLYHLLNGKWQPYFGMGLSKITMDYTTGASPDPSQAAAGEDVVGDTNVTGSFGLKRFFSKSMFVNGELKQTLNADEGDTTVAIGLGYLFGQSSGPSKPAPTPAPAPVDSDNDGVVDSADRCPGTGSGIAVDANGCALDTDGDSVADYRDECPNTSFGANIDAQGCEIEFVEQKASIELSVSFDTNSSVLRAGSEAEIKKAADFMASYQDSTLAIEGHTDNTGAASYNKFLSQKRADAVRTALIEEHGIDASRVSAVGYGEERPIADNSTASGRQANRRVVGVVQGKRSVRKN